MKIDAERPFKFKNVFIPIKKMNEDIPDENDEQSDEPDEESKTSECILMLSRHLE